MGDLVSVCPMGLLNLCLMALSIVLSEVESVLLVIIIIIIISCICSNWKK